MDLASLGNRLRHARLACGLSQGEVAAKLARRTGKQTCKSVVSRWELDATKSPEVDTFLAFADLTGFSASWLASGTGEMRTGVTPLGPAQPPGAALALDQNALRAAILSVFPEATDHQLKTVSTLYAIVAAGASIDPARLERLAAAAR